MATTARTTNREIEMTTKTQTEWIDNRGEDFATCLCGNDTHLDGYACTDSYGMLAETETGPTAEWDGESTTCRSCGRVFSWRTGEVFTRIDKVALDAIAAAY